MGLDQMYLAAKIAVGVLVLYVLVAVFFYLIQRKLMFVPDVTRVLPEEIGLTNVEEIPFRSKDGDLLLCWYGKAQEGKPTLLFFHGNGANIANREEKFRQLMDRGWGVFMLGYRGYGGSEGEPSEKGFVSDARLAYDYLLRTGLSGQDIVIYGESIGSSVAVQLAATVTARALILEAPMSSVTAIAQARYPFFKVRPFLRDRFESDRHIHNITMPLLIIHGDQDPVIPLQFGRALYDLAPRVKFFHTVKGGNHNNLYEFPIVDEMMRFLDAHGPRR